MSGFLSTVKINYQQVLNETVRDDVVDNWFLMKSPGPVFSILVVYLWFVLYQGPKIMENRKPFKLKYVMILYNLYQVVFSTIITSVLFTTPGALNYLWNHCCTPLPRELNAFKDVFYSTVWWYFFSKVVELLDTVFFVLRKKQNQVSILHVYHHTNMVFGTWGYLRFVKGEQVIVAGVINSFVHIVMYSYYLLAALGPNVQKYLWWKKYITKLQLLQFFTVLLHLSLLLAYDCPMPKGLTIYMYIQTVIFIILFSNFYIQAYKKNQEDRPLESDPAKEKKLS